MFPHHCPVMRVSEDQTAQALLLTRLYSPVCITLMTSSATLAPVPPAHSHWTGSAPAASPPPDCTEATPTCGDTCGKVLACANHNCSERYHRGNCPPCLQMVRKECRCGANVKVPCGREKHTKPPRCKKPCGVASNCHHPVRDRHNCHHPPCPSRVGHTCPASCQDNVPVKVVDNTKPIGPREEKAPVIKTSKFPCAPCNSPVPVTCLGQHETSS